MQVHEVADMDRELMLSFEPSYGVMHAHAAIAAPKPAQTADLATLTLQLGSAEVLCLHYQATFHGCPALTSCIAHTLPWLLHRMPAPCGRPWMTLWATCSEHCPRTALAAARPSHPASSISHAATQRLRGKFWPTAGLSLHARCSLPPTSRAMIRPRQHSMRH